MTLLQRISRHFQMLRQSGIKALIITCIELGADYNTTAEKVKTRFQLSEESVTENMSLYWN